VIIRHRDGTVRSIEDIHLPMAGRHNVQNALAAIAVAIELGLDDATIQKGFGAFGGVKRRFTKVGETGGVTIIDDYGHHPVEIKAVLSAAREGVEGRVIAVVQPHRYSRLGGLMDEFAQAFNDADVVYVAPVYAAGETPVEGVSAAALVDRLKARGHRAAAEIADADALAKVLAGEAVAGDMVVCLGAGDITKWAAGLAAGIEGVLGGWLHNPTPIQPLLEGPGVAPPSNPRKVRTKRATPNPSTKAWRLATCAANLLPTPPSRRLSGSSRAAPPINYSNPPTLPI
jgi:UDP-N-acetylmuramate--alanine ligase